MGWYLVHSIVNEASVSFDNKYEGIITNGVLSVQVFTTETPYSTYRVERTRYQTASDMLPSTPAKGTTRDVYVTLEPVVEPTVTGGIVGRDEGWYVVHANVDGATVTFGNDVKGLIASGTLTIPYYTAGTPYTSFTVLKTGYTPPTPGRSAGTRPKGKRLISMQPSTRP